MSHEEQVKAMKRIALEHASRVDAHNYVRPKPSEISPERRLSGRGPGVRQARSAEGDDGAIIAETTMRHLSGNLVRQKEAAITEAVREVAGYDETMFAFAPRGALAVYPDGTEVFSFDGVPLLKFWPVEIERIQEGHSFKVKATRRVQRLNTAE